MSARYDITPDGRAALEQQRVTEANFQDAVIDLAHRYGWRVAHFRKVRVQRKNGSVYYETPVAADGKGWPDLVLVRDRVVFVELKAERGRLEVEQVAWLAALGHAGAETYVWRPSDWDDAVAILSRAARAAS